MFLFIIGGKSLEFPPIGSLPEYWEMYNKSIDINNQTFKCFDNSKVIPLSRLNDNYLDCPDGSDEPGTSLSQRHFYCQNKDYFPIEIESWSVGDGICDCCDGSDEIGNPSSNCSNTCIHLRNEQQQIIQKILNSFYIPGSKKYQELRRKGMQIYKNIKNEQDKIQRQLLNLTQTLNTLEQKFSEVFDTEKTNNDIPTQSKNSLSTHKKYQIDKKFSENLYSLWQFTFRVKPQEMTLKERLLESRQHSIQAQINKLENQMEKTKEKLPSLIFDVENDEHNENATDIAFLPLLGQSSSFKQYNYLILGPLYQNSILIGITKQIGNKNEFEHGDYCNVIHMGRILSMDFICGIENRLINVDEKTTCNYHATMMSPAACSPNNTDQKILAKLDKESLQTLLDILIGDKK